MAGRRGGSRAQRCAERGFYVDGVKVPIGERSCHVAALVDDEVRWVTPRNVERLTAEAGGELAVIVVPWVDAHLVTPSWFVPAADDPLHLIPPGQAAAWTGVVRAGGTQGRRGRNAQLDHTRWDPRNLIAAVHHVSRHPAPKHPEQGLTAKLALAAVQTVKVDYPTSLLSLHAALAISADRVPDAYGEASYQLLGIVDQLTGGDMTGATEPSPKRLRRAAIRHLHRDQAVRERLKEAAHLDKGPNHAFAWAVANARKDQVWKEAKRGAGGVAVAAGASAVAGAYGPALTAGLTYLTGAAAMTRTTRRAQRAKEGGASTFQAVRSAVRTAQPERTPLHREKELRPEGDDMVELADLGPAAVAGSLLTTATDLYKEARDGGADHQAATLATARGLVEKAKTLPKEIYRAHDELMSIDWDGDGAADNHPMLCLAAASMAVGAVDLFSEEAVGHWAPAGGPIDGLGSNMVAAAVVDVAVRVTKALRDPARALEQVEKEVGGAFERSDRIADDLSSKINELLADARRAERDQRRTQVEHHEQVEPARSAAAQEARHAAEVTVVDLDALVADATTTTTAPAPAVAAGGYRR